MFVNISNLVLNLLAYKGLNQYTGYIETCLELQNN